jgi:hypothetical protein
VRGGFGPVEQQYWRLWTSRQCHHALEIGGFVWRIVKRTHGFFSADGPSRSKSCGSSHRRQGSSLRFDLTASGFGLGGDSSSRWQQLRDVPADLPDLDPLLNMGGG